MTSSETHVVIVGAGHAGGSAVGFLRQYGFKGRITLIGAEALVPYQRPPLSKAWLEGKIDAEGLLLRPEAFYRDHDIHLRLSTRVTAIDRARQEVRLDSGEKLRYGVLILATGDVARKLTVAGSELAGIHELRHTVDADGLKSVLAKPARLAIIGGGYIGLEVAAVSRMLGSEVVLLEREDRLLARVACPELSSFYQRYHEERGVRFELGVSVSTMEGSHGRVTGVRLADDRLIAADAVLVGVGAMPEDRLAHEAGLACDGGVLVDIDARTSDPSIFAIGDVTRHPLPLYDNRMFRLESVPNAIEQARQAACALTGRPRPTPEVPWFWSDQYDLKLQIAGLPYDVAERVVRGRPEDAKFAVFHLNAQHQVQAVEAINAAQEFMGGRLLIQNRKPVAIDKLRNREISMKEVAA